MNPSVDDRLASIIRSLTDIILPAVPQQDSGGALAARLKVAKWLVRGVQGGPELFHIPGAIRDGVVTHVGNELQRSHAGRKGAI
jgi:hypothetical protein